MAWAPLSASKISSSGKDRGCKILHALVQAWGGEAVNYSGAVGCFYCESGCDPAAYNKAEKAGTFKGSAANGSGYGAGIAQWSNSWKARIQKTMGLYTPIECWSLNQQIEAVKRTCTSNFIQMLKQCKDVASSTDIWLRGYENGGGGTGGLCSKDFINNYTWCNGYKGAMQHRTTAGFEILKAYSGGNLGENVKGDQTFSYPGNSEFADASAYSVDYSTPGVLSSSNDNIYQIEDNNATRVTSATHTRIYQAFGPAQRLSTMERNTDGTQSIVTDASTDTTGTTGDSSKETPKTKTVVTSTADNTSSDNSRNTRDGDNQDNSGSSTVTDVQIDYKGEQLTVENPNASTSDENTQKVSDIEGRTSGVADEPLMAEGIAYPLIRINDYWLEKSSIEHFVLATTGFVPTAKVTFTTSDSALLKSDTIKDGDIMSVFIQPTQAAYKSLRCDFLITSVNYPPADQQRANAKYTYTVFGELYISNLYNANMTFSFSGTSRDALIYAAQQLKIGFFFNDPENTTDEQMWYCTTEQSDDIESQNRPSNVKEFIISTTQHAWKNFESFFDSWIDPRYGLTVLNINKQLGEQGGDEPIDILPFQSALLATRGADGQRIANTPEQDKAEASSGKGPKPMAKMITNIMDDAEGTSTMYASKFHVINQAGEISRQMGVNIQKTYVIDNMGVDQQSNQITMNYSIPYNEWKMQHGFYMLIGPGKNETYVPGDSFTDFVRTNTVKQGGTTTDIQADSDAESIVANGDNMETTGAVNKFYDAAFEHNRINNLQLQKKYVEFTLNGANFGIMRGEKIPAMIADINAINNAFQRQDKSGVKLKNYLYEDLSGWFIISGIKWEYNPDDAQTKTTGSAWKTIVSATRREWPISGESICPFQEEEKEESNDVTVTTGNGTSVESQSPSVQPDTTVPDTSASDNEQPSDGSVSAANLEPYMSSLWSKIKEITGTKLVQARLYGVNESGEKIMQMPYITNGGQYKAMNESGNIIYISPNTWSHFYGMAINVSYSEGIQKLWTILMTDTYYLDDMYKHGLSAYKETWRVGTVQSDTIHIGVNTVRQNEFWSTVFTLNPDLKTRYADYLSYNIHTIPKQTNQLIEESSITKS